MADYPEDERHVSQVERADALDPSIGEGLPNTAPDRVPDDSDWDNWTWKPSRKLVVRTITALIGLATMWATTGTWDTEETVMALTIVGATAVHYFTPESVPAEA